MDCPICENEWNQYNKMCKGCYEAVQCMITFTNKHEINKGNNKSGRTLLSSSNSVNKGFANVLKLVEELEELEEIKDIMQEDLNEKISYLSALVAAFRERIHPDIEVKPGGNELSIPAHRELLVIRSDIFQNILSSDECKAPPSQEIMLPELNHEELESLLEFLYTGNLPKEKAEKHFHSLWIVGDKYEIPFLRKFCEQQMIGSLSLSNALDVLEISDRRSNQSLKEVTLNFIFRNMEDLVFSSRFDAFALKNPQLAAQITRHHLRAYEQGMLPCKSARKE